MSFPSNARRSYSLLSLRSTHFMARIDASRVAGPPASRSMTDDDDNLDYLKDRLHPGFDVGV